MSIDVVVPCYRYGRYLRQCVESVLSQHLEGIRVLVIDDESPDETQAVGMALASEDSRVTYRRHVTNRGHIATYNEGIEWTQADYMLLLSADDYLLPGALGRVAELMDAHPGVGLCFGQALARLPDGRMHRMKPNIGPVRAASVVMAGSDFVRFCARAGADNIVPTPTAVVRTALLRQTGGYRADLPHSGDFELWLRLAARSCVAVLLADQAVYRRHSENMSLEYFRDGHLADLMQRKAAFDAFREFALATLPDADRLHASLLHYLARRAVGHASAAFNGNRMDLSRRLITFALSVAPHVRFGSAWWLLNLKRLMGYRTSTALLALLEGRRAVTEENPG
jgi:glycosyltransferase involved in cell wall biosynthesis